MRRSHRLAATVGLLVAVAWIAPATAQPAELPRGVYAVDGIESELPDDDLEPLAQIVRRARVVALGEAVHATRGFSQAKVRLIQYMIEELGFRAVGIESPWIGADETANYVATCEGSARDAMLGLFGVWQNRSLLGLVQWMCEWNQANPDDPVYFYGFDHQQLRADSVALRFFLEGVGFAADDPRIQTVNQCRVQLNGDRHRLDACLAVYDELSAYFDANEADLVRATSVAELELARLHIVGLSAHHRQLFYRERGTTKQWFEARDEGMAILASRLRELRFPQAKTVLWAHNGHIARGEFVPESRSMGGFLKKIYRGRYRTIGLIAYEAEIDWPSVGCGPWQTALPGSLEDILHDLGEPYLLVDLAPRGGKPFLKKGKTFDVSWGAFLVPKQSFHGLFYMDFAERMKPLLWSPCE